MKQLEFFPGIRRKNFSLVLMIHFSNILMLFIILLSFSDATSLFQMTKLLRIVRSNNLNKRNPLMHKTQVSYHSIYIIQPEISY